MKKRSYIIIILALCFFQNPIAAQSSKLDSVVVTASMQPQKEKETGRNIFSISGHFIQNLPVNSLDELLKYLPGIEVQQRGPQGSQADILIRGGTFQQVLVVIDGVRINDPLTGHFNAYIPLNPQDISKIEICKGAAAAVYGSDAIGGVINIITHQFPNANQPKQNLSLGSKWGSFGSQNHHLYWGINKTLSKFSISGFSNQADGETLRGTKGYFKNQAANMAFSHLFSNGWKLAIRSIVDNRDFNAQNFYTTFKSDTAKEKINSFWTQVSVSKQFKKMSLHTDLAYKNLSDKFQFNPSGSFNENKSEVLLAQSYLTHQMNATNKLTTGIQFLQKTIRSNDRGNHSLSHMGGFVLLNHQLPHHWFLNESIRLDWDGNYGWVILPQINAAYVRQQLTIRGSIGKGLRDADFTERFNNYNKTLVTSGSIGNPNLKTEDSWSYELGADYRISNQFKLSSTLFHRNQANMIDWVQTAYADMPRKDNLSPSGTYSLSNNLSSVKTTGIELDIHYSKQFSKNHLLNLMTGWVWLDSKDKDNRSSFYIISHAKFLWNTQIMLQTGKLTTSLNTIYKERNAQEATAINSQISKSYFLMNAKLNYKTAKDHLNLMVELSNVLNQPYSDLLGATMPGRWFSAGMQINL